MSFDTGMNNQADVNTNLAASETTGNKLASEILFKDAQGDMRTAMAGSDRTRFEDGGFRGITQADARTCNEIASAQLAATLVAISQDRVQAKLSSIQNIG